MKKPKKYRWIAGIVAETSAGSSLKMLIKNSGKASRKIQMAANRINPVIEVNFMPLRTRRYSLAP